MTWIVTDMERNDIQFFESEIRAKAYARTSLGTLRAAERSTGYYRFQSPDSGRELYVVREDQLRANGFDDITVPQM